MDCDTYDTDEFFIGLGESTTQQTDVPYLDVSASVNDNELIINVVNRHKDKAITTDIISQTGSFDGPVSINEVNGESIKSRNDFGMTEVKIKVKDALKVKGNEFTYSFPAHSFTQMKVKIKAE